MQPSMTATVLQGRAGRDGPEEQLLGLRRPGSRLPAGPGPLSAVTGLLTRVSGRIIKFRSPANKAISILRCDTRRLLPTRTEASLAREGRGYTSRATSTHPNARDSRP